VHHDVLLEVLCETPTAELPELARAASEFLLEVLATFDMAQRGFLEEHLRDELGSSTAARVQGAPAEGAISR
jgi:hypothetical protein